MTAGRKCLALFLPRFIVSDNESIDFMHENLARLFPTVLILSASWTKSLITSGILHMQIKYLHVLSHLVKAPMKCK